MPRVPVPRIFSPPSKPGYVVVSFPSWRNGKLGTKRKWFKPADAGKAQAMYDDMRKRYPEVGAVGLALNAEQRSNFHALDRALAEAGGTWSELIAEVRSRRTNAKAMSVANASAKWLSIKARVGSARSDQSRRKRIAQWLREARVDSLKAIDRDGIESFLFRGVADRTLIQDASAIREFCAWLLKERLIGSDPMAGIDLPTPSPTNPIALRPSDFEELMELSRDWPGATCYHAIGTLAGLRPSEIMRLKPESFVWRASQPSIQVDKVKRGKGRRLVPIIPKLAEILHKWGFSLPTPSSLEKIRGRCSFAWQPDIMRHTYISAAVSLTRNPQLVSEWAGNSEREIRQSYLVLMTEDQARAILGTIPQCAR